LVRLWFLITTGDDSAIAATASALGIRNVLFNEADLRPLLFIPSGTSASSSDSPSDVRSLLASHSLL
jgi:hypothetical protein